MKIIDYINRKRRERILCKLAAIPHKKRLPRLDDVRTIGIILYGNTSEEDKQTLNLFNSHMIKRNILVTCYRLPLIDDKENLTRIGLPTADHLATFTSHTYDVLIAATRANDNRTLFAVLNTPAHLRVAYDDTDLLPDPIATETYDLFIRGTGECHLVDLLREVLSLLSKIKK